VQWDGKYLAVGDGTLKQATKIYRFSIKNNVATVRGSATLIGSCGVNQFAIYHREVVAASGCGSEDAFGYWKYPEGGEPIKGDPIGEPYGVTISL
jgi:hypothetical protein